MFKNVKLENFVTFDESKPNIGYQCHELVCSFHHEEY